MVDKKQLEEVYKQTRCHIFKNVFGFWQRILYYDF